MLKKSVCIVCVCLFAIAGLFSGNCPAQMEAGGWSTYEALDEDTQKVFDQVTKGLEGVDYTPLCVSKQVVAGMNYCFFCVGKTVVKEPVKKNYYIEVYVDLGGKSEKPEIKQIPHQQVSGGYSIYEPVTEADKALLKATRQPGFTYTPFCVSRQAGVKGGNPKFFCEGKAVVPDPIPENAFVTLDATDDKNPKIADTKKVARKDLPHVFESKKPNKE